MTELRNYLDDGANYQARAVMCFLQRDCDIEESWNERHGKYDNVINIARWENCREQGYIVSMVSADYKSQLNIAFFEHRNSDEICAVKWEQTSMNTITIDTAEFGDVYKDKYDVSKSVSWGEVKKMADWIKQQFTIFWRKSLKKDEKDLAV
jgi:hypothetical protein